jgi:hypothetical protein
MNIFTVLFCTLNYLSNRDRLEVRLVCKECTFDYNYMKTILGNNFLIRYIAHVNEITQIPSFIRNQISKFGITLKLCNLDRLHMLVQSELFKSVKYLDLTKLYYIDNLSDLSNIYKLDLSGTDVEDVSALSKVHTLKLRNTMVQDVSMLGNIHTLDLSYTNVEDVSALSKVYNLDLSFTNVEDVSALGNVHYLNLSGTSVRDVSMLGNVHTLCLYNTSVEDVSALYSVYNLDLDNTNVSDVSTFTAQCKLCNCKYKFWNKFHNAVHILKLSGTDVTNVSMLYNVCNLDLSCTRVTDVNMLTRVYYLNIEDSGVRDISMLLGKIPNLIYDICMFNENGLYDASFD